MRVLTVGNMYPPHHLGGYERVWEGAVEAWRADRHDVRVLTTTTRTRDDTPPDPAFVERVLPWFWADHRFPPVGRREARRLAATAVETLAARVRDVDVVAFWSMGGMPLDLLAVPGRAGVSAVAIVHDAWPVYGPIVDASRPRKLAGLAARPVAWDAVAAWSFNSAWMRDAVLMRRPEIDPDACRVDHPGIDLDRLPMAAPRPWSGRLLCLGRIDERKGIDVVIRALADLPDCTLDVVGDGDPTVGAGLERLAADLAVADRVRFRGAVDDVASVIADADVVVFPVTWDEPFGLVPLEAMAVGRPVVATATGGAAEYLRDGENALVVPRHDPDALAAAVRRLGNRPEGRERLVSGGRDEAGGRSAAVFEARSLEFVLSAGTTASSRP